MLLTLVVVIVILVMGYLLFVSYYPTFGGDVSKARQELYANSDQFADGAFKNTKDVPKDPSFSEMLTIARKFFFQKVEHGRPSLPIEVQKQDSITLADYQGKTQLIWFGHSAFLLQMEGKNILIDPMLSDVPAPHPWLGGKRFSEELPVEIEKLPKIDAVIISHDHYDHLDYESIKKLKGRTGQYFVPLGVGVHLEAWGVSEDAIEELDWWEEVDFEGLQLACTPAQHFSGRKFDNRQSTLWASWVIKSATESIFFSGDSGYGEHFKEIGEEYGPFDFAMMECGQYNKMWPDIHMFPEETVQAGLDVGARAIMPIHWGGFKLAMHSWTDPIERATEKASELQVSLVVPQIGEPIRLSPQSDNTNWWRE